MKIIEIDVRSALQKSGLPELDYSFNPYLGCFHKCSYCYAMDMTKNEDARSDWGNTIIVKKNIIYVLKKEMAKYRRGIVGISTITDPYQPVESRYRITRSALGILLGNGFRVSIQTKSPLVLKDLDLIRNYKNMIDVGMTITTMDAEKSLLMERQTPPPGRRVAALKTLSDNGIRTWIFYGPIIEGFNDSTADAENIIKSAKYASSYIIYDFFSYYPTAASVMSRIGVIPKPPGNLKNFEEKIMTMCRESGIECRSEKEDNILERQRLFRWQFI